MPLQPGTTLGPYEIQSPLGAGGPAAARAVARCASFGGSTEALTRMR
jgi:hypothetical protein